MSRHLSRYLRQLQPQEKSQLLQASLACVDVNKEKTLLIDEWCTELKNILHPELVLDLFLVFDHSMDGLVDVSVFTTELGVHDEKSEDELVVKKPEIHRRRKAVTWSEKDSKTLKEVVATYGAERWSSVAVVLNEKLKKQQKKKFVARTAAQCSQHWHRVIDPRINKGPWTPEEDKKLMELYNKCNGSWSKISQQLPQRADTQCRRRLEKLLGTKLKNMRG